MKKLITLGLIVAAIFTLCSCRGMLSGDNAEASEGVSDEPPNAMAQLAEENRKMRLAFSYLQSKDSFSESEKQAAMVPQKQLMEALKCYANCNSAVLNHIGLECGVNEEQLQQALTTIRSLACVPLRVNIPNDIDRKNFLTGLASYEEGKSEVVVCYKQQGELLFHVKGNKGEVIQ